MPSVDDGRYRLRLYGEMDYDAVLAIFRNNTPHFFAPSEIDEFIAFLRAPASECVVATSAAGVVVGFGAAYCRSAIEGGLAWSMVHRGWHRHGIGRALLDARIARRWALSMTQIRVQTSQHGAGFFAQADFAEVAVTQDGFAPGVDHVTILLQRTPHGVHAGTGG